MVEAAAEERWRVRHLKANETVDEFWRMRRVGKDIRA